MQLKTIVSALLISLTVLSCNQSAQSQNNATVVNIDGTQLTEMDKDTNTIIIDVRTSEEVNQGYIPGTNLFMDFNGGQFDASYKSLDTSKTYIIYCRSGKRSSNAADMMIKAGFSKVYNLSGGISNWKGDIVNQ